MAQNANRNRCTTDIAEAKSKKLHQQKSKFLDVCAKKQKAVYRKHLKFSADRSDEIDDRLKDLSELVNLKKQVKYFFNIERFILIHKFTGNNSSKHTKRSPI